MVLQNIKNNTYSKKSIVLFEFTRTKKKSKQYAKSLLKIYFLIIQNIRFIHS